MGGGKRTNLMSALDRRNVNNWLLSSAMTRASSDGDSAMLRTLNELLSLRKERVRL